MALQLQPFTQGDFDSNPRLRESLALLNNGEVAAAIDDLKQQAAQGLAGAAFLLAAVYFQEGRFDAAVDYIDNTESLHKDSPAWTLVGVAYLRIGKPREAYRALKRALILDWQNAQAHRFAWDALDNLGLAAPAQRLAMAAIERDHSVFAGTPASGQLDLGGITACAIDCINPALAARALRMSASTCRFAGVKLLTSTRYRCDGVDTIDVPHVGSKEAYSAFVLKELHRHVSTDFVLLMQWDGYVICPSAWTPDFLSYDYIGARWVAEHLEGLHSRLGHDVGNGGFSLRSRRLMETVATLCDTLPIEQLHPEDAMTCRQLRPTLQAEANIRFAPGALADRFSVEHSISGKPTFGFHGAVNLAIAINNPAYSRLDFLDGTLNVPC